MSKKRDDLAVAINELKELGYTSEHFKNLFNPHIVGNSLKVAAEKFDVKDHDKQAVIGLRKIYDAIISNQNMDLVLPLFDLKN